MILLHLIFLGLFFGSLVLFGIGVFITTQTIIDGVTMKTLLWLTITHLGITCIVLFSDILCTLRCKYRKIK